MSVIGSNVLAGASGQAAGEFQVDRSLRFNDGDSPSLSRNFSSAGNRKKWTWSGWFKVASTSQPGRLFSAGADATNRTNIFYYPRSNNLGIGFYSYVGGSLVGQAGTTAVLADHSAWYHLVFAFDAANSTTADRLKIYINGVELAISYTVNVSDVEHLVNNNIAHYVGRGADGYSFDGYLADVHFIDDQALAASDFGEFDDNGVWQPKAYSGTYGTNGFHLDFSDNSSNAALGTDSSGNSNTWTVNNLVAEQPTTLPGVSLDGSSYLSLADSNDFDLVSSGTGDFTIEFYVYLPDISARYVLSSGTDATRCYINGSNRLHLNNPTDSFLMESSTAAAAITANKWTHIAFCKSSSTGYIFVDGIQYSFASGPALGGDLDFNDLRIGRTSTSLNGFISNLRILKGTALYTANFTPPTAPLSNVTNTKLLCCQSSSSATAAAVAPGTITANGNAFATEFSDSTSANDSLIDTPTNYEAAVGNAGGNYATWNPLDTRNSPTLSNGNLSLTTGGTIDWQGAFSTIEVSSGKWYFEATCSKVNTGSGAGGSGAAISVRTKDGTGASTNDDYTLRYTDTGYLKNGNHVDGNVSVSGNTAVGDVIGIAFDADLGSYNLYINGSQVSSGSFSFANYTAGDALRVYTAAYPDNGGYVYGNLSTANFGQRPFAYTPPAGYKSLCTTNLPDPTIADGSTAMDAVLYTGTNASKTITGLNFSPDFIWTKSRSRIDSHGLHDIVRGRASNLYSDLTAAENTSSASADLVSFDSNGYTLGTVEQTAMNRSGETYVAWIWDAGANSNKTYTVTILNNGGNKYYFDDFGTSAVTLDLEEGSTYVFDQSDVRNAAHPLRFATAADAAGGTEYTTGVTVTGTPGQAGAKTTITVASGAPTLYYYCSTHNGMGGQANTNSTAGASNFDGSIQSTVRANASAGFSIVKFTNGNGTVGHGLNSPPELILTKDLDATYTWSVYSRPTTKDAYLALNSSQASSSVSGMWGSAEPTSSVFGTTFYVAPVGDELIAYCFAPVEGYSAFGSYTGNGSTNGPFVFTGMRPAWTMVKRTDAGGGNWTILDNARNTSNPADALLFPNLSDGESTTTTNRVDLTSNGFKLRGAGGNTNASGGTYIYAAFAEHPFKTARAR